MYARGACCQLSYTPANTHWLRVGSGALRILTLFFVKPQFYFRADSCSSNSGYFPLDELFSFWLSEFYFEIFLPTCSQTSDPLMGLHCLGKSNVIGNSEPFPVKLQWIITKLSNTSFPGLNEPQPSSLHTSPVV